MCNILALMWLLSMQGVERRVLAAQPQEGAPGLPI